MNDGRVFDREIALIDRALAPGEITGALGLRNSLEEKPHCPFRGIEQSDVDAVIDEDGEADILHCGSERR